MTSEQLNSVMPSESTDELAALTPSVETLSAGQMLKKAREAAGIHVAALAVALKVSVKKLEALEAGDLDGKMDAVFIRALASSVCRHLQISPEPILAKLPLVSAPKLTGHDAGINTEFHAATDPQFTGVRDFLTHRTVLLVAGILVCAGALYAFPYAEQYFSQFEIQFTKHAETDKPAAVEAVQPHNTEQESAPSVVVAAPVQQLASPVQPDIQMPTTSAAVPVAASAAMNPSAPALAVSTSTPTVAAAPVVAPTSTQNAVAFRATGGESWVEVTDSTGKVLLRKLLTSSETVGVSGQLPLTVVVGKAAITEVWVHGKAFDLGPITRENVARFEVKN